MTRRFAKLGLVLLIVLAAPAPAGPLTDAQRQQLATARDEAGFDEGALYALLAAAVDWPPLEARGAIVPDFDAIAADPAAHRGQKFLIEGGFVAADELRLARAGPWGRTLTYWAIKHGDIDAPVADNVVIVLMVSPEGTPRPPRVREPVRVPAVFYKVWQDRERHTGKPVNFLTFVARAEAVPVAAAAPGGGWPPWSMPLVIIAALGAAWFALRRTLRAIRPPGSPVRRASPSAGADPPDDAIDEQINLPEDPVEAMAVLKARHEEAQARLAAQPPKDPAAALTELEVTADQEKQTRES